MKSALLTTTVLAAAGLVALAPESSADGDEGATLVGAAHGGFGC